jgi:hypothetical protein
MANENPEIDMNILPILHAAASILQTGFLTGPRVHARREFKKLKRGKSIKVATLNIGQLKDAPLKLQLDYSEYKGPGFGFDSFIAAVTSMLRHTETAFNEEQDLNMLGSQNQSELVLAALPGIVRREEQFNVMMMSFSFNQAPDIILKLMFVEPGQFNFAGNTNT